MKDIVYLADIKSHRKGKITGHYLSVARNYMDALEDKYEVRVAGCSCFRQSFNDKELLVLPFTNNGNYKLEKLETFLNAIYLFWKARGNIIILQQSTVITSYLCLLMFFWMTSDLYIIQYDTESIKSRLGKILWKLVKRKVTGLICPNERIGKAYNINYLVVTDYIYSKDKIISVPLEQRKWDFAAVGNITKDKGTLEIVEYLAKKGKNVLIAGRVAELELEQQLTELLEKYTNIEHHIGFVDNTDYITYIQYSKYCLLNYKGGYFDRSSGVVLDIIFNGTPVLGSMCAALNLVAEHGLGFVYKKYNEINFEKLLDKLYYEELLNNISAYGSMQALYRVQLQNYISSH